MNEILLGGILFTYEVKVKKIKNSYLRFKGNNHLMITCHSRMSPTDIIRFIKSAEPRLKRILNQPPKEPLYPETKITIFGNSYHLVCQTSKRKKMVFEDGLYVLYTPNAAFDSIIVEKYYQSILLQKAKAIIQDMDFEIRQKFDLSNITLKAQKMKTQLGSCHVKKRIIKLNSILVRFSENYLRAILCHEIVHLKISGHQSNFYRELEKLEPDYKQTRKNLKNILSKYEV